MSSFKYPANPADGDIIVRGDLLATYNKNTNTWVVSQMDQVAGIPGPTGPAGPVGPVGPPGAGVEIAGTVDTFDDLPAAILMLIGEFWFTDDTNTLYFSDGVVGTDLGSPIQGPPGEEGPPGKDGTDGINGINGTNGAKGADGKGWTGTTINDGEQYTITFESNDGLGFTTTDLKGPKGDPGQDFDGELPLATTTSPGIVQIGQGVNVDSAGNISVNIDDVDTNPGGGDNSYSFSFQPSAAIFNNNM